MKQPTESKKFPDILYSCYTHKSSEGEQFVPDHVLSYTISGRSDSFVGNKSYQFEEGGFRFFRKNQLTRYTKYPAPGGEYKSVSVCIDEGTLREMSESYKLHAAHPYTGDGAIILPPNNLLRNYIDSLRPYLNTPATFHSTLKSLKVKEAVMILLETNPVFKNILFDFSTPGKLDLEAYMNAHYRYNVALDKFAYLTGRSLATFKRDFEKTFGTTPNKWLQQKRLTDAYYLITEKGWKSSDVYLEVGFKDLSHFSFAFKKEYGVPPSKAAIAVH